MDSQGEWSDFQTGNTSYQGPPQIMHGGGVVNMSHIQTGGMYQHGYTQQQPGVFPGQNPIPSQMGFTGQNPIPHQMGFPGHNPVPGFPGQYPMQYQTGFPGQNPVPGQNPIQYGMVHPQNPQWTHPQNRPNTSHTPQSYQTQPIKKIDEVRKEAQEEQRRRELQIQKRKMEAMNVTKPTNESTSLETLIGFKPESKPSPSFKAKMSTQKDYTKPNVSPVPNRSPQMTQDIKVKKTTSSIPSVPNVSIDQLLTDSLINIDRKAKKPVRSSDFKSSNTSSTSTSEKKTFTESNKSRTWGGVSDEFSGLFAQDVPPTIESQSESITGYHDNSFGEFQSVPISQKPISEHSSGTFSSPVLTHMATPSTQSPQVVHSQFHTPLTLTSQAPSSALSESDLPSWLISAVTYNASQLPPVYYLVYQRCSKEGSELTNTQTLFPILVSSGLDRSVLRDMWSLVNKTIPGTLSRLELYALLGMIGLVQSGKSLVTLSDLKSTSQPPQPHLAAIQQEFQPPQMSTQDEFGDFQSTVSTQNMMTSVSTTTMSNNMTSSAVMTTSSSVGVTSSVVPPTLVTDDSYSAIRGLSSTHPIPDPQSMTSSVTSSMTSPLLMTSSTVPISKAPPTCPEDEWANFTGFTTNTTSSERDNPSISKGYLISDELTGVAPFNRDNSDTKTSSNNQFSEFDMFSSQSTSIPFSVSFTKSMDTPPLIPLTTPSLISTATPLVSMVTPPIVTMDTSPLIPTANPLIPMGTSPLVPSTTPSLVPMNTQPLIPMGTSPLVPSTTPSLVPMNTQPLIPMGTSPLVPSLVPQDPSSNRSSTSLTSDISDKKQVFVRSMEHFQVWKLCLSKCDDLLKECVSVLCDDTVDSSILQEIIESEEPVNKLIGVVEVYRFAKRIHTASRGPGKKYMTPGKSQSLMKIMMSIRLNWNKICRKMPENAMTRLLDSLPSTITESDDDSNTCSLCLLPSVIFISPLVTFDGFGEQYTLVMEQCKDKTFHCQCADFWCMAVAKDIAAIP